jgi:hypothetical protein
MSAGRHSRVDIAAIDESNSSWQSQGKVSVEQVKIFRRRAQQERTRAAAIKHPGHKAAALKLADQYDAVADSYARLIELGGSMFG